MLADLRASTAHVHHQVRARMDARKLPDHQVPPDPQDGELAVLIDQGIVGEGREFDAQGQLTRIEVMTSPCLIALTTSIPSVTFPKTV